MARSYASMTTLITQKLQSTGTADFSVAEVDNQIEEGLKELSVYIPHIVPEIFKIESRYGIASTTLANNLVDATKDQFLAADATEEKVIHNITDNTWAVVLTFTDAETLALSRDIFVKDDEYKIYNKRCTNKRQIYLGDMPKFQGIESIEYKLGNKRNWKLLHDGHILEIDADTIEDSNANTAIVANLPNVDVLVRFRMPHVLSQLTDWAGTFSATAAAAATALSLTALQSAGTIEEGELCTIENLRLTYVVTADATIAANTVAISIYPPLEAAIASTAWAITFRKSSLEPDQEDVLADLVAANLAISKSTKFFNAIAIGGQAVGGNYLAWGERRRAETLFKLKKELPWQTKRRWPSA